MFGHVLIPTDGSHLSTAAMQAAMTFARDAGAKATALTVVEPFHIFSASPDQVETTRADYEERARAHAGEILAAAEHEARRLGVSCDVLQLQSDDPYLAIIDTAQERGCDLIAMGSHGRRGVAALVLGSVTQKVLTHSKLPVLVYR